MQMDLSERLAGVEREMEREREKERIRVREKEREHERENEGREDDGRDHRRSERYTDKETDVILAQVCILLKHCAEICSAEMLCIYYVYYDIPLVCYTSLFFIHFRSFYCIILCYHLSIYFLCLVCFLFFL